MVEVPAPPTRRRKSAPAANFDSVAHVYRWAEYLALGPLLKRTREQFLPQLTGTQRALVLGDGDGQFAARLLETAPDLQLHAADSSAAMLRLLEQRCKRQGDRERLTIERSSVLSARIPPHCDLVATHFLLDCLSQPEVQALADRIAGATQPGCRWVVSEFGLPRGRLARRLAAAYIRGLYFGFRVLTGLRVRHLPDPQKALLAAGFVRTARVERLRGLLYAEFWVRA